MGRFLPARVKSGKRVATKVDEYRQQWASEMMTPYETVVINIDYIVFLLIIV